MSFIRRAFQIAKTSKTGKTLPKLPAINRFVLPHPSSKHTNDGQWKNNKQENKSHNPFNQFSSAIPMISGIGTTLFWLSQQKDSDANTALADSTNTHTISAETALEIIASHNALVKVIFSYPDISSWHFILGQLQDPRNNRPVAPDKNEASDYYFNPRTGTEEPKPKGTRGSAKETELTKKTPTSLLPEDGQMELYGCADEVAGILFDLNKLLDLHDKHGKDHDKYLFPTNAFTNTRWWRAEKTYRYNSVSIDDLRLRNCSIRENDEVPKYNELLMRLSKRAFSAVFSTTDTLEGRLNALHKEYIVMSRVDIDGRPLDLPVLIITPHNKPKVYTEQQQQADQQLLLEMDKKLKEARAVKGPSSIEIQELMMRYPTIKKQMDEIQTLQAELATNTYASPCPTRA